MPLLEVVQTRHLNASVRFTDTTVTLIDQYVAFVESNTETEVEADQIIEEAVLYAFNKDRQFQEFRKTPQAKEAASTLRVRKAPSVAPSPAPSKPPARAAEASASVAGSRA